jgi:HK97 family phage portal protein
MKFFNIFSKSSPSYYLSVLNGEVSTTKYYNRSALKLAYIENIIVYRCINLITQQASQLKYKLFAGDKEIENHPLLTLLNNPYPTMASAEFLIRTFTFFLLYGQSFIWMRYSNNKIPQLNTPPQLLYPLRPDYMSVKEGQNFLPSKYIYSDNINNLEFDVTIEGQSNIIHLKKINPANDYIGLSPIMPAAFSVSMYTESSKWNYNLVKNGARPSGIIKCPLNYSPTEEQRNLLSQTINSLYSGAENAGKSIVLPDGLEWIQQSFSPVDMDLLNAEKTSAHKIALAFNVPMDLLNTDQAKYDNLATSAEQLLDEAILPLINNYIDELNMVLVPRYGKGLKIRGDLSSLSGMNIKRTRKREVLEKTTYLTINEKRVDAGYEKIDNGDDIYIPFNMVPLGENRGAEFNKKINYVYNLKSAGFLDEEIKTLTKLVYNDTQIN